MAGLFHTWECSLTTRTWWCVPSQSDCWSGLFLSSIPDRRSASYSSRCLQCNIFLSPRNSVGGDIVMRPFCAWLVECVCAWDSVHPSRFALWARYRLVFARPLSNFTCHLFMMRGGTLLILGHGVKGQGHLWHFVSKTLWARYRLVSAQLLLNFTCRIYKYKMFCRLESLDENMSNIRINVKHSFNTLYRVFLYKGYKYADIIKNVIEILWEIAAFTVYAI